MLKDKYTTRNLPEGEVLYTGIKDIHINRNDQSPMGEKALAEVEAAISIAPNNSFFGSAKKRIPFPFGLWIYNSFKRYEKGLGKWIFKKLAAEPVLLSTVNPDTRVKVASNMATDRDSTSRLRRSSVSACFSRSSASSAS